MKIKHFILTVFLSGVILSSYLFYLYQQELLSKKKLEPINNYKLLNFYCHSPYDISSNVDVLFNNKIYSCTLPYDSCVKLKSNEIKPEFYYLKNSDKIVFKEYHYVLSALIISCFFTVLLPLMGLISYRKELNDNYKTM